MNSTKSVSPTIQHYHSGPSSPQQGPSNHRGSGGLFGRSGDNQSNNSPSGGGLFSEPASKNQNRGAGNLTKYLGNQEMNSALIQKMPSDGQVNPLLGKSASGLFGNNQFVGIGNGSNNFYGGTQGSNSSSFGTNNNGMFMFNRSQSMNNNNTSSSQGNPLFSNQQYQGGAQE